MPRKSTSSTSAKDGTVLPVAENMDGNTTVGTTADDGVDTSMLSVPGKTSTNTKTKANGKIAKEDQESAGIDDLLLPRTLTSRLARGVLPANTSVHKDALLALTKAATVFISHLASNANELTSKKTVGPQDVLKAIHEIEMEKVMGVGQVHGSATGDGKQVVPGRLERELELFENVAKGKRKGYRDKVKARDSGVNHAGGGPAAAGEGGGGGGGGGTINNDEDSGERETKKPRYADRDCEDGQDGEKKSIAPTGRRTSSTTTTSLLQPRHRQRQERGTQKPQQSHESSKTSPMTDPTPNGNLSPSLQDNDDATNHQPQTSPIQNLEVRSQDSDEEDDDKDNQESDNAAEEDDQVEDDETEEESEPADDNDDDDDDTADDDTDGDEEAEAVGDTRTDRQAELESPRPDDPDFESRLAILNGHADVDVDVDVENDDDSE